MMTLEEYSVLVTKRMKRLIISNAIYLLIAIPVSFYGGNHDRTVLTLAVVLSTFVGGAAASWVEWSEIRKHVKKNNDDGDAIGVSAA